MTLKIIGAGMAGLLAANMLRRHDPIIYEAQPSLPNNHSAVLRFRSSIVGDTLGIPFRKVTVLKSVIPWKNPVADALAYSYKNTGMYRADRSIIYGEQIVERYIAPDDLVERMAKGLNIVYGHKFDFEGEITKVISTIPMPELMRALKYPRRIFFHSIKGTNIRAEIDACDAFISLAIPDPDLPYSRISITGRELIVECPRHTALGQSATRLAEEALDLLGIRAKRLGEVSWHEQKYAKILPIDEEERQAFIHWASSEKMKAYQLGRFSVWRPGLLMDDLVNDVKKIEKWINLRSAAYDMDLHRVKSLGERS